jgi:hypothetical protein
MKRSHRRLTLVVTKVELRQGGSQMSADSTDAAKSGDGSQVKGAVKGVLSSPLVVALVTAGLTVLVVPLLTREWQNHEKRLKLKTAIAIDMSRSTANAVGAGRRVGTGVVYAVTADPRVNRAVIQDAYNRGLGQWQVDKGRLAAQLFARFSGDQVVDDWRGYTVAVEQFYRLGAVIPKQDRRVLVTSLGRYLTSQSTPVVTSQSTPAESTWREWWRVALVQRPRAQDRSNLKEFYRRQHTFRKAYIDLSDTLLLLGNRLVEEVLSLSPRV